MLRLIYPVILLSLSYATIVHLDNVKVFNSSFIFQKVYMFKNEDSTIGGSIDLSISIHPEKSSLHSSGVIETVVLSNGLFQRSFLSSDGEYHFCCDESRYQSGLCSLKNHMLFPQSQNTDFKYSFSSFSGNQTLMKVHYNTPEDGVYYYLIGSCDPGTTNLQVDVTVTTLNKKGYLPASFYYDYPFTGIIITIYLFMVLVWNIHGYLYSSSILPIHSIIKKTLFLFLLSSFCTILSLSFIHNHGYIQPYLSVLQHFLKNAAVARFHLLLFQLASGSGSIPNPYELSQSLSTFFVSVYSLFFTALSLSRDLEVSHIMITFVPVFIETLLISLLYMNAMNVKRRLKEDQEEEKLKSFKSLVISLLGVVGCVTLFNLFVIVCDKKDLMDSFWKVHWFFSEGITQLFYVVAMMIVVIHWFPTEHATNYMTHIQLATDEMVEMTTSERRVGFVDSIDVPTEITPIASNVLKPMEMNSIVC